MVIFIAVQVNAYANVSPHCTERVENAAVIFVAPLGGGFKNCIDKATSSMELIILEQQNIRLYQRVTHTRLLSISHLKVCDNTACGKWFRQRWHTVTNSCG